MRADRIQLHSLRIILLALLAASGGALIRPALAQQPGDADASRTPPTLTVTGNAEVSVEPDQAVVRLGVTAQDAEAAGAQDQVNGVMQQVLQAVLRLDVPEQSIRTEQLSLSPVYSNPRPAPVQDEPQEPRITGYRASNVVSVELEDLSRVGDVIDAGLTAGANELQGISFRLKDDAAARLLALRAAVRDARAQADVIAAAMDMRIDGVDRVIAGNYDLRPPVPYQPARFSAEIAATSVQPGQVDVSASLTVIYDIRVR